MAFALGYPSADHFLEAISRSHWLEWLEWIAIRGPIGAPRDDFYANVVLHAARQTSTGPIGLADILPWVDEVESEEE